MARTATEIEIPLGEVSIDGTLAVPENAAGLVMFAHGSGSSRHSPRNRYVAALLNQRGLATLLFDLLTVAEEEIDAVTGTLRFDIDLLADRLTEATDRIAAMPAIRGLPIGYFGSSTGAAAALIAAANRPGTVAAVVSRGGRCDLAASALPSVRAPTLMIVGGEDTWVLRTNREVAPLVAGPQRIEVIEGATHLFEEEGALDAVARLAGDWFVRHFAGAREVAHTQSFRA
ncbi:MAG: alpha/beta hydrolase [Kofleriaceae bacterium]|nr:alpha/beta hydrolase [Kofleriaceae bacterium]